MIPLALSFITGGFSRLFGFLAKLPWQVWLGLAVAVAAWWYVGGLQSKLTRATKEASDNAVMLETSRQSLIVALAIIAQKNAESDARAAAFEQTKRDYTAMLKTADAQAKATDARIAQLQAMTGKATGKPECRVPDALAANLGGL